jgi:hypothetical protein
MTVEVSGDPVTYNGEPVQAPMPFPPEGKAPNQPQFRPARVRRVLDSAAKELVRTSSA